MRQKLKFKIIRKYKTITNFAKEIGYGRVKISMILHKKIAGSIKFWRAVQKALDISDTELLEYMDDINE